MTKAKNETSQQRATRLERSRLSRQRRRQRESLPAGQQYNIMMEETRRLHKISSENNGRSLIAGQSTKRREKPNGIFDMEERRRRMDLVDAENEMCRGGWRVLPIPEFGKQENCVIFGRQKIAVLEGQAPEFDPLRFSPTEKKDTNYPMERYGSNKIEGWMGGDEIDSGCGGGVKVKEENNMVIIKMEADIGDVKVELVE